MGRLPQTNTSVSRFLRQQKRVVTRLANSTPYALSGTSVVGPGLTTVDERLVAGTPGGSRVELDSAGLRKYAADGTTVQVDLTGDVAAFSGLITGSEIIAGTAGAARIELDATGLRQYAADGTTVLLDTADDATIRVRGDNTAFGGNAQKALTTGSGDTAVGSMAQQALTTGTVNTAVGAEAQRVLTTGTRNTVVGSLAQKALTTGTYNTAVGAVAQASLTDGDANTAVGWLAQTEPLGNYLNATKTASFQTSIGPQTGQSSATQVDGITTIGYRATAGAANATSIGREARADHAGSIALGYQALTTQVDQVMVGPRDVEITDTTKGLVLVSPDGTRYRVTVANGGALAGGGGGAASETAAGIVELATSAETITGTDTVRATTPAGVKAAMAAALPDTGWIAPTLLNGWVAFGQNFRPAAYRRFNGGVEVRGTVKNGTGNIFILPTGFRPANHEIVPCWAQGGSGIVYIYATGEVFVAAYMGGSNNAIVSIKLRFAADGS